MLSSEEIHRGIFPSQIKKGGLLKSSVVTASHLWNGQLSVWRLGTVVSLELDALIEVLEPLMIRANGERFSQLRPASVSVIRNYQVDDERAFSVLDECDLDDKGNKHRAHAHVAICEKLKAKIASVEEEKFNALQEWLKLVLEQRTPVWQRA
ncbi:hypothetical protein EAS54_18870 [Bradyrhizobium guangzhouense]|nr:hypothetical protein EAS54_18870 [Bradyrhizobium guangzhouense]